MGDIVFLQVRRDLRIPAEIARDSLRRMGPPDIKDLEITELKEWLVGKRQPTYRAEQIFQWLFQKKAVTFSEMSNLPAALREDLEQSFTIGRLEIAHRDQSRDGTKKFLFHLSDGLTIESVLIPERQRRTLCLSVQAGCGYGCKFCATGQMGLLRNLQASEIVDQVLEVQKSLKPRETISNLVLMGMGEPLANYRQTVAALNIISNGEYGLDISPRRITVSTVGLIPQMKKLIDETRVHLAVSLHASSDSLRSELVPINRTYPLADLLRCCRTLPLPKRKRITFEYVLLRGVNDSAEDAKRLSGILGNIRCKVNLIPFNPHPGSRYQRPEAEAIRTFQDSLRAKGFQVNVREPRGDDIRAACGQLYAVSSGTVGGEQSGGRGTRGSLLTAHS